jgi:hypothetical protein
MLARSLHLVLFTLSTQILGRFIGYERKTPHLPPKKRQLVQLAMFVLVLLSFSTLFESGIYELLSKGVSIPRIFRSSWQPPFKDENQSKRYFFMLALHHSKIYHLRPPSSNSSLLSNARDLRHKSDWPCPGKCLFHSRAFTPHPAVRCLNFWA